MKKSTLRTVSVTLGALLAISSFSMTASAELWQSFGTVNEDFEMTYALREKGTSADTVYIDSESLKNGDYVFKAALYLKTEESLEDLIHFHATWDAVSEDGNETKYITTENIYTYREKWNDDRTNRILDELDASTTYYVESYYGGIPHSAGPNQIYIDNEETGERNFYTLTVDEKTGVAKTMVSHKDKPEVLVPMTIHHYDPNTPYGERFLCEERYLDIHCLSGFSDAWTGTEEVADGREMGNFDVIIDQDTPDGVYYLKFAYSGSGSLCPANCMSGLYHVYPSNAYTTVEYAPATEEEMNDPDFFQEYTTEDHNDEAYWLKIVVGNPEEAEAEETSGDVNMDGTVDITDATEVLRVYAQGAAASETTIPIQQASNINADVNGDGVVDLADATAILEMYAANASALNA
ncbi:MAG: dockerin type I repeat-containing protein [Ruminococcus sp.]